MNAPKSSASVSVVIGAYNAAPWIGDTLRSVLSQTYPVLEALVVDDGSTDDTARIVKSMGRKVKYMHEDHRGRPHRNRGIQKARGDYVAFIDADDLWHPQKLEMQMQLLGSQGLAWVVCEAQWLDSGSGRLRDDPNPRIPEGDVLEKLFLKNFIVSATPVVAKHVFEEVGYFEETPSIRAVEDWDLWLRIAALYPLGCVRQELASVRLHADSFLASTSTADRVRSLEAVVSRAVRREPRRLGALQNRALANIYFSAGVELVRRQQFREARGCFVQVLRQRGLHGESLAYVVLTSLGPAVGGYFINVKRLLWK